MEGAFSQASYLKLLNKAIVQNWKLKELFNETFDILKHQCSHPYNKVRHQISVIMVRIMLKSSYHTRFERGANLKKNAHKNQVLSLKVLPMGSSKSAI